MRRKKIASGLFFLAFLVPLFSALQNADGQEAQSSGHSLVGTILSGDFTGAVLVNEKGEQNFYRVRERLPDDSQVVRVEADNILIRRSDGSSYHLYIVQGNGKSSPVAAASSPAGNAHAAPASPSSVQPPVQPPAPSYSPERPPKAFKKGGRRARSRFQPSAHE